MSKVHRVLPTEFPRIVAWLETIGAHRRILNTKFIGELAYELERRHGDDDPTPVMWVDDAEQPHAAALLLEKYRFTVLETEHCSDASLRAIFSQTFDYALSEGHVLPGFIALPPRANAALMSVVVERQLSDRYYERPSFLYFVEFEHATPRDQSDSSSLVESFTLASGEQFVARPVTTDEVELIYSLWPHRNVSISQSSFATYVQRFPSCCIEVVHDDHRREPVAWAIVYSCGAIGALHVIDEYRRRGLAARVLEYLLRHWHHARWQRPATLEAHSRFAYAWALTSNTPSNQLFRTHSAVRWRFREAESGDEELMVYFTMPRDGRAVEVKQGEQVDQRSPCC